MKNKGLFAVIGLSLVACIFSAVEAWSAKRILEDAKKTVEENNAKIRNDLKRLGIIEK